MEDTMDSNGSSNGSSGNGNTGLILAEIRQLRTEILAWRTEHDRRIRSVELRRCPTTHTHDPLPERLADRLRAVEGVVLKQTIIASIVGATATGVTMGLAWLTGLIKLGGPS